MSCDEDAGEAGEDELEELVDGSGTTNGTQFVLLQSIFLPFLTRCGFLTTGPIVVTRDLRIVFQVKELPVYLQEALLSRINPIL